MIQYILHTAFLLSIRRNRGNYIFENLQSLLESDNHIRMIYFGLWSTKTMIDIGASESVEMWFNIYTVYSIFVTRSLGVSEYRSIYIYINKSEQGHCCHKLKWKWKRTTDRQHRVTILTTPHGPRTEYIDTVNRKYTIYTLLRLVLIERFFLSLSPNKETKKLEGSRAQRWLAR